MGYCKQEEKRREVFVFNFFTAFHNYFNHFFYNVPIAYFILNSVVIIKVFILKIIVNILLLILLLLLHSGANWQRMAITPTQSPHTQSPTSRVFCLRNFLPIDFNCKPPVQTVTRPVSSANNLTHTSSSKCASFFSGIYDAIFSPTKYHDATKTIMKVHLHIFLSFYIWHSQQLKDMGQPYRTQPPNSYHGSMLYNI